MLENKNKNLADILKISGFSPGKLLEPPENILYVCDPCMKEHHLQKPENKQYQSIRPCNICVHFKKDTENKPTTFIFGSLNMVEMNAVRRKYSYTELGYFHEIAEFNKKQKLKENNEKT